jgi:Lipocalin-like domain
MRKVAVIVLIVMTSVVLAANAHAESSNADNQTKVIGIWKLVSYEAEYQATGEREPVLGKNWTGYIIFTPEGRMMVAMTSEGRQAPKIDQDRAELLKSMVAYSGMYRLEGDKFITKVDVSWNPAWVGTEQVRFFRFEGGRLQITTAWLQAVNRPERGMARGFLTWERAK